MKRRKFLLPLFCNIICIAGYAQQTTHIIKQGENISSLARKYQVNINDIFRLNNLNDKTTLRIGQKIAIPNTKRAATPPVVATTVPTATIPTSNTKPAPNKNQHQIVAGDNLSKIAKQYRITEQQLKDWNNLKTDIIKAGSYLYIAGPEVATVKQQPTTKPTKKEEVVATAETNATKNEPVKIEPQPQPAKAIVKTIPEEKPVVKEIKQEPKAVETVATAKSGEGYFQNEYASTKNFVEGLSGTFKTIAGWHDSKYYVLLNNVQSGSVVKISANNKSVYAKVLGALPNIKEDNNLKMRVSNATATALGIAENRFNARIDF